MRPAFRHSTPGIGGYVVDYQLTGLLNRTNDLSSIFNVSENIFAFSSGVLVPSLQFRVKGPIIAYFFPLAPLLRTRASNFRRAQAYCSGKNCHHQGSRLAATQVSTCCQLCSFSTSAK